MFRPSQSLLFRPFPALNKLRIHHPLPLNARESRQLLNLLTSSFRNHLDAEHSHSSFRIEPSSKTETQDAANYTRRRSNSDPERGNYTDRHLHSVLTNPLLNTLPLKGTRHSKDPMETFDQAVAMGMMTIRYANACLLAKKRQIVESSILSVQDGMRQAGAGLKVLHWLTSSGTANGLEFLMDKEFSRTLLEYIVAESLQEAAWRWIRMSFDRFSTLSFLSGKALRKARHDIARPLLLLVKAEMSAQKSLDDVFLHMSRAAGYLKGLSSTEMQSLLWPAGEAVLYETIKTHSARPRPSQSNFESLLSLLPVISPRKDIWIAHLCLVHPTEPDTRLALKYLRSIDVSKSSELLARRQIMLGLDVANFLLRQQHQQKDAEWVINFLQTNFPQQLGLEEKKQLEQAKAEATSLELLERLGLA